MLVAWDGAMDALRTRFLRAGLDRPSARAGVCAIAVQLDPLFNFPSACLKLNDMGVHRYLLRMNRCGFAGGLAYAAASSWALSAPSSIALATIPNALLHACSYPGVQADPAISAIEAMRISPTTG